jgi:hypothetical protein
MEEVELILSIFNKKERFHFFEYESTTILFDCFTFSLYELPETIYIENDIIKCKKIDNGIIVFLHDILFKCPKLEMATNVSNQNKYIDSNNLSEQLTKENFKDICETLDKNAIKYIYKIITKKITRNNQKQCNTCPWYFLCEYEVFSTNCSSKLNSYFEKLLLLIFIFKNKTTKESYIECFDILQKKYQSEYTL